MYFLILKVKDAFYCNIQHNTTEQTFPHCNFISVKPLDSNTVEFGKPT